MRTGKAEALDIFRKWMSEGRLITWEGSFRRFSFSGNGRVRLVSDEEIRLMTDNSEWELVIKFTPDCNFGYTEPRRATQGQEDFAESIIILYSPILQDVDPESIALAAK